MAVSNHERRQYSRIELEQPLRGFLDDVEVKVVEVSVSGLRIEHDSRLAPAPTRRIRIDWNGKRMEFGCVVARSMLVRLAKDAKEKSVYQSGIRILDPVADSEQTLREYIADRVTRALADQKENARGIPPIGQYTFQVGKGDRYRRCEFIEGKWRKSDTAVSSQPPNGFTVSAELDPNLIDVLCATYERTSEEGRRLTKMLAELSIKKTEGGTTRRYVP